MTLLSMVGFFVFAQEQDTEVPIKKEKDEPIYDSVIDRVLLRQF